MRRVSTGADLYIEGGSVIHTDDLIELVYRTKNIPEDKADKAGRLHISTLILKFPASFNRATLLKVKSVVVYQDIIGKILEFKRLYKGGRDDPDGVSLKVEDKGDGVRNIVAEYRIDSVAVRNKTKKKVKSSGVKDEEKQEDTDN